MWCSTMDTKFPSLAHPNYFRSRVILNTSKLFVAVPTICFGTLQVSIWRFSMIFSCFGMDLGWIHSILLRKHAENAELCDIFHSRRKKSSIHD